MDDEFVSENIIPFAKRSQIVKRFLPQPILSDSQLPPPEERYGPDFWERLIRQPNVYKSGVSNAISSYPVWKMNVDVGSLHVPGLETLPPPSELCRRKKRKQKSPFVNERRVMSVQHHIQELWRKQSSIDQLKSMKWGGYDISKVGVKEKVQTDVSSIHHEDDLPDFLDIAAGYSEEENTVYSISPQQGPVGVVFPWMTPQDDVPSCYLDSSMEEQTVAGDYME
ncbi:protein INCA1 [Mixophyes fleayi]|uniref:protein INCA1 n=1 Tax=Mixophyes fleayi TaxID=3061075 RepID=UPI003F4D89FC